MSQWMQYVHNVIGVFLSTVRRAGFTLLFFLALYLVAWPMFLRDFLHRLLSEALMPAAAQSVNDIAVGMGPIVNALLPFAVLYLAFLFFYKKFKPVGKKGK